jgi:molecular chaperone Hsp33
MSNKVFDADVLHRFIFSEQSIRGECVQLNESVATLLRSASYPQPVSELLAQMASAASLLSATLKFEGEISLQIQGKGPVSYAVVDATHSLTFRGVARWDENLPQLPDNFAELCAKAVLVITLTPSEGERYQGVVALDKASFAECIEAYFEQSEQLLTRIYLFSELNESSPAKTAGLLLQVLPTSAENTKKDEAEAFHHFATLADTLTAEEALSLPVETLLHRLYHEHDVTLFEAAQVKYQCTCSRQRSATALLHVDKQELLSIINEQGKLEMNCQYCGKTYAFDSIDVEAIHSGKTLSEPHPNAPH